MVVLGVVMREMGSSYVYGSWGVMGRLKVGNGEMNGKEMKGDREEKERVVSRNRETMEMVREIEGERERAR